MSEIDPYIRILFIQAVAAPALPESFVRRDELATAVASEVSALLKSYNAEGVADVFRFAEKFVDDLIKSKVVITEEHKFAGTYYKFGRNRYQSFRVKAITGDEIALAAERVGSRFFSDVFNGFLLDIGEREPVMPALGLAPGSNRVVTFSDNQRQELQNGADCVIEAVEAQNQLAQTPGLRELVLGQLRAGREMIRTGCVRVYLIELTLLETLKFLAKRYERETIGALASTLMVALARHLGLPS